MYFKVLTSPMPSGLAPRDSLPRGLPPHDQHRGCVGPLPASPTAVAMGYWWQPNEKKVMNGLKKKKKKYRTGILVVR